MRKKNMITKEISEKLSFGYNLKRICKEKGVTIREVATQSKVSVNTLYSITKRKSEKPTGEVMNAVIDYMTAQFPELTERDFLPVYDEENDEFSVEQLNREYQALPSRIKIAHEIQVLLSDLNDEGIREALKRVTELTQLEQYKKED